MLSNQLVSSTDLRITTKLIRVNSERTFPKAIDIEESIKQCSEIYKIFSVSDMFPRGFVHKPYLYDSLIVDGDENYRKLKRIKAAKYISYELLKNYRDGSELFRKLNANAASIPFEHGYKYIVSSFDQVDEEVLFNLQNDNPFENVMIPNGQYDIYLSVDGRFDYSGIKGKLFSINRNIFEIINIVDVSKPFTGSGMCVLQGDLNVLTVSDTRAFESAIFRCRYDSFQKTQYIKAGSVLTEEIYLSIFRDETTSILPFVLRI